MFLLNSDKQKILLIENLSLKLLKGDYIKIEKYIKSNYKKQSLINTFINNINISKIINFNTDLIIYDLLRKKKYIISRELLKNEGLENIINTFFKFDFNKKVVYENFLFYGTLNYLDKNLKTRFINSKKDLLKVGIVEFQKIKIGDFYISFGKFSYSLGNYRKNFYIGNNTKGIDLNKNVAKHKMISEAVERISASLYNKNDFIKLGNINEKYVINPFNLNTKNLNYVKVKHFLSKKDYYIPADYIFYPYESNFINTTSSGMSTHLTYKKAKANALLELIERDAYIIAYLTKKGIFKVNVLDKINNVSLKILNLLNYLQNKKINYNIFAIKLDNKIPVIMFVLEKNKKTLFSLGSDFLFSKAIEKAVLEGVSMIEYLNKDYKQINYKEDLTLYHIAYYLNPKNFEKIKWIFDINQEVNAKNFPNIDIYTILSEYQQNNINFYYYKFKNNLNESFKRYTVRVVSDKLLPIYFGKEIPNYILKSDRLKYWLNYFNINNINKHVHPFG